MSKNKLTIAAAGSGKTTYLIKEALKVKETLVLIVTYTEANAAEIKKKILERNKFIPGNIEIQTWFSFLLQNWVRPYQDYLRKELDKKRIGFCFTNKKSGQKYDKKGNPITFEKEGKEIPIYYDEEKNFMKHYFTTDFRIYSDKISKFAFQTNEVDEARKNCCINRLAEIYSHLFIDEVQDLAGYDLDLLKVLFASPITIQLVGDPRQTTYLTHHENKYKKYRNGKIAEFVDDKCNKRKDGKTYCEVDVKSLSVSHRNKQKICDIANKLYPDYTAAKPCECADCPPTNANKHQGIYYITKKEEEDSYLKKIQAYKPVQLIWDKRREKKCHVDYRKLNFGVAKGLEFDHVLIYLTKEMEKWINKERLGLDNKTTIKELGTKAKLYVAITRARYSVAFVANYKTKDSSVKSKK